MKEHSQFETIRRHSLSVSLFCTVAWFTWSDYNYSSKCGSTYYFRAWILRMATFGTESLIIAIL